jgi:pantoate--beta-alanine ligase
MARDLDLPVEIVGVPTVREPDGLALSSRNFYLSPEERRFAPSLNRALRAAARDIAKGGPAAPALERAIADLDAAGFAVEYLELRDAETLAPLADAKSRPARLLAAARLGRTRLIDNIAVAQM